MKIQKKKIFFLKRGGGVRSGGGGGVGLGGGGGQGRCELRSETFVNIHKKKIWGGGVGGGGGRVEGGGGGVRVDVNTEK